MESLFDISNFNIIEDEENYYFFRALNIEDNNDIETGTILDDEGNFEKIRTDRERYEENPENRAPKYDKDAPISLEQVYDHIKMHYRKDTNCISLSSNSNVSISYGRGYYKDKYVMVKVPKKELGEKVINAGQYMLEEIEKRVDEYISSINPDSKLREALNEIDNSKTSDELSDAIKTRYTSKEGLDPSKAKLRKGITYRSPVARVSSYQALNEKQSLEKNKIIAKLTLLERVGGMEPIIPHTANNNLLVQTVGNAFSSLELIHYGDVEKGEIIDVPKEVVDIFALLQQVEGQDQQLVRDLKREVIRFASEGKSIEIPKNSALLKDYSVRDNISIEEMYDLTDGKVEYGQANSVVKDMFYLAKAQTDARELTKILSQITENNPKYRECIQYIANNGFEIEPEIITRQSNKGVKLSESVSLDLRNEEIELIDKIKELSEEEQIEIVENGGLSNIKNIMSSTFSKTQRKEAISKEEYYAEAIFSLYDWQKIGIKEFTVAERNNLIERIQNEYCVELYQKLEAQGIDRKDIPTVLLNMVTRKNDFEITEKDTPETIKAKRLEQYDRLIAENRESLKQRQPAENAPSLKQDLSIERIERFLGYYDVPNTGIQLRPYQQRAVEKTDEILQNERFASVILPTGGGKSFVALSQMMEHKDGEMLYLAPQNEILEQMKDNIIKYIHGPVNTVNRSKDQIIADIFPNLKFAIYPRLLARGGKEIINKQYGYIVLDELHRTGAKEWGDRLNTLIDNQPETTKVLGITATPRRDADGMNMATEMAQRLGYTNREAVSGKHIAMNMSLTNAIRMGLVVNPKLVSCAYSLKADGSLDRLKESIEQIDDVQEKNEKLQEYEKLRRNVENAKGIPEILQANVKKGGKYIVFLPIVDELEDEDGNVIGRKKGKDKISGYEKQMAEYFKDSDIVPNFHSMLGEYGDKENAQQLEEFQNSKTDETEFMLVMNKANEGLHLNKLDGMIWLRPLDENSRILYLQQLGRVIYSEDPDNPTKDEDRPVVIDLVNNTLKVNWENEITEQDDIQMLNLIVDWYEKHDGTLPNINSSDKEETGYATVLKEIQNKYKEYLENDFDGLNKKQVEEVKEIIKLGSQIDLWQIELPERIVKNRETHERGFTDKNAGPFELTGLLRDFVELEDEVDEITITSRSLKNALEIKKWCETTNEGKKIYERRMPRQTSKDEYEKSLGIKLNSIRTKIKEYEGKPLEEIKNKEDRQIVEIIRKLDEEYKLGDSLKSALEIKEWCETTNEGKKIYERKMPSSTSKDEYEKSLGQKLNRIRTRKIKEYEGKPLEEIRDEEDRQIVEIIRKLDAEYNLVADLKNALEIKEWCETTNEGKKIYERRLPSSISKDEYEKSLGIKLSHIRQKIKKYEGKPLEEIKDEEDRKIVQIIRKLDKEYKLGDSLKNALEIKEWCEMTNEGKKIYERRLLSQTSKDEYEKSLGIKLNNIRAKIKKYEGKPIEEIKTEEDRKIVKIIRALDEKYNYRKRRTSKEIAEASISSLTDIEMSDKEDEALKELIEKQKEGGLKRDE